MSERFPTASHSSARRSCASRRLCRAAVEFVRILQRPQVRALRGATGVPGSYGIIWEPCVIGIPPSCRGVAQPGSAPALGAGSPRFESGRPDHLSPSDLQRTCNGSRIRREMVLLTSCQGSAISKKSKLMPWVNSFYSIEDVEHDPKLAQNIRKQASDRPTYRGVNALAHYKVPAIVTVTTSS